MLIKKFHAKSEISSRRRRERPLPLLSPLRANPIPQRQHTPIRVFNSFHGHCEHAHWNYFIRVFHRLRELTSLHFERTIPRPFKRFHKGSLSLYLYLYLPSSTFPVHLISSSRYIVRSLRDQGYRIARMMDRDFPTSFESGKIEGTDRCHYLRSVKACIEIRNMSMSECKPSDITENQSCSFL